MRFAAFPACSPWFKRSLRSEYTDEQIAAMEPRKAVLTGITDKRNVMHTARVSIDGVTYEGMSQRAPEALRMALRKYEAERVELVSVLTGPAA